MKRAGANFGLGRRHRRKEAFAGAKSPPKAEGCYVGKHLACNALRGRRSETKGGAADKHRFLPCLNYDPMLPP